MAYFSYKAVDKGGHFLKGEVDAANIADLELRLSRMELDLVSAKELKRRAPVFSGRRVTRRDLITFCFHMEQLVRAGVPILEGLEDLRDSLDQPHFKEVVSGLINSIEGGKQLSEALRQHPRVFDPVFVNLVHAGEVSGRLAEVLTNLVEMLKWQDELVAQGKKVVMYPAFVGTVVMGVIFFLMIYLVPQLTLFIKNMGGTLPLHTRALIGLSSFLVHDWMYVLTVPPVFVFLFLYWARVDPAMRFRFHGWKLRVWLVGPILRKIILARFASFFAMMYASGITIMDALIIAEGVVNNEVIADALRRVRVSIADGNGVAVSFERVRLFPVLVVRMLRVGENTGALDVSLRNVSYFYERDVRESIARLQTLVEPIMTVILGLILGWVMLSVLGPIYDIISKIGATKR